MDARPTVIEASHLGKLYKINTVQRSTTLREALRSGAAAPWRWARRAGLGDVATEQELWAVDDVSFSVAEGETVGLIGANGSGKSTLLKIIARIVTPTTGEARIRGRVGALLEVGTGFHPELSGRENIFLNGALIGMSARDIRRRFDEIVEFSGMKAFLDLPIKRYSSGMAMRLAFAVAAHLEPDVLIIDEVLAVGDAEFQRKCLARMDEVSKSGCTVLFVSHNLAAVQRLCDRAILLEKGRITGDGPAREIIGQYLASASVRGASGKWVDLPPVPGVRPSGPVIRGVRFANPGLPASGPPRSLYPLQIETKIESPRPMPARLAVDVSDELGNKLVNADPWKDREEVIELPKGASQWRFDIESLYLEPGRYVIDVWLADARGSTFDFRPMAVGMDVLDANGEPADPARAAQADGLVACRLTLSRSDVVDELRRAR
jgi:lipopolysaccharide transport system ATP-binding protein